MFKIVMGLCFASALLYGFQLAYSYTDEQVSQTELERQQILDELQP